MVIIYIRFNPSVIPGLSRNLLMYGTRDEIHAYAGMTGFDIWDLHFGLVSDFEIRASSLMPTVIPPGLWIIIMPEIHR